MATLSVSSRAKERGREKSGGCGRPHLLLTFLSLLVYFGNLRPSIIALFEKIVLEQFGNNISGNGGLS